MKQQSFIYSFLLAPQFRIWRYLTLIIFFSIVSVNQVLVGYQEIAVSIGERVYWLIISTVLIYLVTIYLFSKFAVNLLLSRRYTQFIFCIVLCATLFTAVSNIMYDSYIDGYDFFSMSIIIDNLSSFVLYILCISGVIIPIFLRNWIIANRHLNQLKIKMEMSQVEQLKEQINPKAFFKVLNKSGSLVKSEPEKSSTMLIKLSQLLRYQLYDCNRLQVLLTSEIAFLRNFLELEILCSSKFNYTITASKDINGIFIPPSILLPYVQNTINTFENEFPPHSIDILVNNLEKKICITLKITGICNTILLQKELLKVKGRLMTLYKDHYELTIHSDKSISQTEIILSLDKK